MDIPGSELLTNLRDAEAGEDHRRLVPVQNFPKAKKLGLLPEYDVVYAHGGGTFQESGMREGAG